MKLQLDNYDIEYESIEGHGSCIIFCPGFKSTMQGNKARSLKSFCLEKGWPYIRFDYSGHGQSGGAFVDGCISNWLADTVSIIDRVATTDVILVGSSMGGWIALLAALQRPNRVKGLLLIACAADMTKYYQKRLEGVPAQTDESGRVFYRVANQYDDQQPYSIYQHLIDDGASYFVLNKPIDLSIPVRLIHGLEDDVIEWQRSSQIMACLSSEKTSLLTIESGDHRLSREEDIDAICELLLDLRQA